jgi:hypothetical protein
MIHRREFLKTLASFSFFAGFVNFLAVACGGSSSSSTNCRTGGTSVSIGTNHGHTTPLVSATDVNNGNQQTYTIGIGSAGHSHTVTVTAASFTTLQGNSGVTISTDADGTGHSHSININCA